MIQYSERVDPIVYKHARDFDQGDWLKLAMAAIDQAGISTKVQEKVADLLCVEVLKSEDEGDGGYKS